MTKGGDMGEGHGLGCGAPFQSGLHVLDDCHAIHALALRAAETLQGKKEPLTPEDAKDCLDWLRHAFAVAEARLEPELIRIIDSQTPQSGLDTILDEIPPVVED